MDMGKETQFHKIVSAVMGQVDIFILKPNIQFFGCVCMGAMQI
jgi:hypothetical protein